MDKHEKLIYVNEKGQNIEFSVWSPFFLSKIEGISGLKNIIYTTKGMQQDGEIINGTTLNSRYITMQGSILGEKDKNRSRLLSIMNPKLPGKLIYVNNEIERYVDCVIETAPNISKDGTPKFFITFECGDPFWKEINDIRQDIALWVGTFEFILEIPEGEGIEMGYREPSLIVNVENNGDVATGMTIEFKSMATIENPSLFNVNTREFIKINKIMKAGEILTIHTEFANKKIELNKNGIITNAFNWIDLDSTFLQLDIGENLFRYDADKNLDNLEVSITYNPQYLGV